MSDRMQKMERTLLHLEDQLSEIPWDDSFPVMWMVYDALDHDGHDHGEDVYCITNIPIPLQEPRVEMPILAQNIAMMGVLDPSKLDDLIVDRSIGIAFSSEAWLNSDMTPEQRQADQRMLADIVGSKEVRLINGIDFSGNSYFITHIRDGERKSVLVPKGGELKLSGAVYDAMSEIARVFSGRQKALT